jgi:hypothetical protein
LSQPTPPEGEYDEGADDDTGPLRVSGPSTSTDRTRTRDDGTWASRFDTPVTVTPRPIGRDRKPIVLAGAAVVVVVLVVAGLAIWLSRRSSVPPDSSIAPTTSSSAPSSASPDAGAQARIQGLLPRGYAPGSCELAAPSNDALAVVNCAKNSDPDGPVSATFTLVRDKAALRASFDAIVHASTVVVCPGNIQSPGPWRRNATPAQTSGTLFCGFQQGGPTVAWTTDDDLLVSTVTGDPRGPNLDQLYAWWSSHSLRPLTSHVVT